MPPVAQAQSGGTLGDVLYARESITREPEQVWAGLVGSVAARDELALHALYERAHRPVFTLAMRITGNREIAEDLTVEVLHDVWRLAPGYDPAKATVLGWIMNQARYRAIDALPAGETTLIQSREGQALRAAIEALRPDEKQAIEAAFAAGLTPAEAGARLDQPLGATKTRVRSGLHKLREAMGRASGEATSAVGRNPCGESELTCAYVLRAVPASQAAAAEQHISSCSHCKREMESLRPIVGAMATFWPADLLRPSISLKKRLARRIAADTGAQPVLPAALRWPEPSWEEVAPGISCKLLATDAERHRVSMLVRLVPNASYPPHTHAGVEELHLLNGELWIEDRKLFPGDYNLGDPGTSDQRVWTETGCACVLVTSTQDQLR